MDACMVPMGNPVASTALSPVAAASRCARLCLRCAVLRCAVAWGRTSCDA